MEQQKRRKFDGVVPCLENHYRLTKLERKEFKFYKLGFTEFFHGKHPDGQPMKWTIRSSWI